MSHRCRKGLGPVLAAVWIMFAIAGAACAQTTAHVAVDASKKLAIIPPAALGLNTAVWDKVMSDPSVPQLVRADGATALRYPGGSTSDVYHWRTNSPTGGRNRPFSPENDYDHFMSLARAARAIPIITVNYGSNAQGTGGGDPAEAAAWVRYSNHAHHYGVKYWEIGNEVYGNGFYGADWEEDLHGLSKADRKGNPALGPVAYGQNVVKFARAMKAQDPSIKIGVVLTAPGLWPSGQSPDWNSNVLAQCGKQIGFVIVHWYPQNPGKESDPGLLASPAAIPGMVAAVRALTRRYCGARDIPVLVTETNSVSSDPGKQTLSIVNALFLADECMRWLEAGAANVDIWALHNGVSNGNESPSLFGNATYGDYGVLSNGGMEPLAQTPFPSYYGLQMLTHLGRAGDAMVSSTSDNSLLAAHAVRRRDGKLAILLVNKDPSNACKVNLSIGGFSPAAGAGVFFYGKDSRRITASKARAGRSFAVTVPPYSLTTIVLAPGRS